MSGHECKKCGIEICINNNKSNNNEFIKKSIEIHNNKYNYSKVEYITSNNKVIIICEKHGEFKQNPHSHLSGNGCQKCATELTHNKQRSNTKDFIEKAKLIHGDNYDYTNTNYIDVKTNIIIICKKHGNFKQKPNNHLNGAGCSKCNNCYRGNINDFIEESNKLYNNKYDYSLVNYKSVDNKVDIICKIHGLFQITPYHHIKRNQECPKCCKYKKYSKLSIIWLNFLQKYYNIIIQHAENNTEYKISNINYKADGYCKETNTVFEFHGTIFHGDPRLCNQNEFNYFGKNYGELYQKTLEREQQIKDLGYNLVVMWEYDWNKINNSIKTIQRKFRNSKLLL